MQQEPQIEFTTLDFHHLRLPLTLGNAEVGDVSRDKRLFPL